MNHSILLAFITPAVLCLIGWIIAYWNKVVPLFPSFLQLYCAAAICVTLTLVAVLADKTQGGDWRKILAASCVVIVFWYPLWFSSFDGIPEKDVRARLVSLQNDIARAGLASPSKAVADDLLLLAKQDPGLAMAGIQLRLEEKIRQLSARYGQPANSSDSGDLLLFLAAQSKITTSDFSAFRELRAICRTARQHATSSDTARYAVEQVGIPIFNRLDQLITAKP